MVGVLRNNTLACSAGCTANGLHVVGVMNTPGAKIPTLPSLWPSASQVGVHHPGEKALAQHFGCPELFTNFSHGDVVWVDPIKGEVRSVLSSRSNANTLLLTEQCENRCLFCSQPPNDLPDKDLYLRATLALLNFNTNDFVGLSGGEPTTNPKAFLGLLRALHQSDCPTKLHILSHGRNFRNKGFTKEVSTLIGERAVVWGIPLYGHTAALHDTLVASDGAFSDTIVGLSNLAAYGQEIELRTIPTTLNIEHLVHIMSFVATALIGVRVVSIMNMEPMGLGRHSFSSLYVPVQEQVPDLEKAVSVANRHGIEVRLFNYPLCLLSENLRNFAVQSISDWKNYYPEECNKCSLRKNCGGLFSSSTGRYLEPVEAMP